MFVLKYIQAHLEVFVKALGNEYNYYRIVLVNKFYLSASTMDAWGDKI